MSSTWIIRPGVSVGPFLLGDSVLNTMNGVSELGFPYRLVYDITNPLLGDLVLDLTVLRLIFDASTQRLRVIHMYPFPQPISLHDVIMRPSSHKYKSPGVLPPLSLEVDPSHDIPPSAPLPCLATLLPLLGHAQTCVTSDLTCVFAYPEHGLTLVCPYNGPLGAVPSSVSVFPSQEPHILIHASHLMPVAQPRDTSPSRVLWYPPLPPALSPPALTLDSLLRDLPSPPLSLHDHSACVVTLLPGVGACFSVPSARVMPPANADTAAPETWEDAPMRVSVHLPSAALHDAWLRVGDSAARVAALLGTPPHVHTSTAADVHAEVRAAVLAGAPVQEDGALVDACARICVWSYPQRGVNVMLRADSLTVFAVSVHNALPAHPSFARTHRCPFLLLPARTLTLPPAPLMHTLPFTIARASDEPSPPAAAHAPAAATEADVAPHDSPLKSGDVVRLRPHPLEHHTRAHVAPATVAAMDAVVAETTNHTYEHTPVSYRATAWRHGLHAAAVCNGDDVLRASLILTAQGVRAINGVPPLNTPHPHAVPWREWWPQSQAEIQGSRRARAEEVEEAATADVAALVRRADKTASASEALIQELQGCVNVPIEQSTVPTHSIVDEDARPSTESLSEVWSYWWDGVSLECDNSGLIAKVTIY